MRKNALKNTPKTSVYQQCKSFQEQYSYYFSDENLEALARDNNFIKRSRKVTASSFSKTLIFNQENQKQLSLLDLKCDFLENSDCFISQEAIHKRFTPAAVSFMKSLLAQLIPNKLNMDFKDIVKSQFFKSIYIKDSSKFKLPLAYR